MKFIDIIVFLLIIILLFLFFRLYNRYKYVDLSEKFNLIPKNFNELDPSIYHVHWIGRFGNRMFQYAYGCHYSNKHFSIDRIYYVILFLVYFHLSLKYLLP